MDTIVGKRLQLDDERTKEFKSMESYHCIDLHKHFTASLPLEPLSCGHCFFGI